MDGNYTTTMTVAELVKEALLGWKVNEEELAEAMSRALAEHGLTIAKVGHVVAELGVKDFDVIDRAIDGASDEISISKTMHRLVCEERDSLQDALHASRQERDRLSQLYVSTREDLGKVGSRVADAIAERNSRDQTVERLSKDAVAYLDENHRLFLENRKLADEVGSLLDKLRKIRAAVDPRAP